ncbi:hypothetical protein AXG93_131s1420 [Marchantia polymorpha subsp. ruderalis]|uniref:Uncharacterized protein n=1 Tax=Marchantia polymorpha subsp. ruderalis TaxID=1480154 RepID=A0A176W1W8_MARPO|nr:hypothetical protein AXG93_131s1420 [Marchantia polymorpha subsp. ruderalis]
MGNFPKILQNQTIAFTGHLQFCMSCESAEICVQSHAWPLLGGARNLLPPRIITVILSSVAIQNSGLCLVFYPEEESLNTLCSLESRKIMARLHGPLVLEMSMNHRTEEDTVLSRLTIGDMVSSSEKYTVVKSKIRHNVTREVCSVDVWEPRELNLVLQLRKTRGRQISMMHSSPSSPPRACYCLMSREYRDPALDLDAAVGRVLGFQCPCCRKRKEEMKLLTVVGLVSQAPSPSLSGLEFVLIS